MVQLRVGEALTLLPLLFVEAVPALFTGCILVNVITGCMLIDVVVGSVVTLISAILTRLIGKLIKNKIIKIIIGGIFPVVLNALILPVVWAFVGVGEYVYILQVLIIFIGQSLAVYGVGTPIYLVLKNKIEKKKD